MKNRIFFLVGLILLILVVWATTMIGIRLNEKSTYKGRADFFSASSQTIFIKRNNFSSTDFNHCQFAEKDNIYGNNCNSQRKR